MKIYCPCCQKEITVYVGITPAPQPVGNSIPADVLPVYELDSTKWQQPSWQSPPNAPYMAWQPQLRADGSCCEGAPISVQSNKEGAD